MSRVDTPLDGGYGWVVVFGSFLANFLLVGMPRSFGVLYVVLIEKFQSGAAETAWIHALYNTLRMVLGPLASILCDRFGCRKVVMMGGLVLGIGVTSCAFSKSVFHMYITYGTIAGVGGAFIFAPIMIIISDYFDKKKGIAMALSTVGSGLGTVVLAPLITFLLSYYGFTGTMMVLGGILFNVLVAGALFRKPDVHKSEAIEIAIENEENNTASVSPLEKIDKNEHTIAHMDCKEDFIVLKQHTQEEDATEEENCKNKTLDSDLISVRHVSKWDSCFVKLNPLKNFTFMLYCLNVVTMPFCIQTVFLFIPGFTASRNISKTDTALLLSIMGISDMIGRILLGFVYDLPGIRNNRRVLHSFDGILFGLITCSIAWTSSFTALVCVLIAWGVTEGGFHSQRGSVATEIVDGKHRSISVGYMIFAQGIGNVLGPVIGGTLKDVYGSFELVFIFGGICHAATSALFLIQYIVFRIVCQK